MEKRKILLFLLAALLMPLLAGCATASGDVYQELDRLVTDLRTAYDSGAVDYTAIILVSFYRYLRQYFLILIILSIAVGAFLLSISKRTKKITKAAIYSFLIGFPVVLICVMIIASLKINEMMYG